MADVFTVVKRSQIMRAVKPRGNRTTELKLASFFRRFGHTGWRRNSALPGSPDFTFPQHRIAVFVDGCFWHGHSCRNTSPTNNASYWKTKIEGNIKRDRKVSRLLRARGWRVLRIWECKMRDEQLRRRFDRERVHSNAR